MHRTQVRLAYLAFRLGYVTPFWDLPCINPNIQTNGWCQLAISSTPSIVTMSPTPNRMEWPPTSISLTKAIALCSPSLPFPLPVLSYPVSCSQEKLVQGSLFPVICLAGVRWRWSMLDVRILQVFSLFVWVSDSRFHFMDVVDVAHSSGCLWSWFRCLFDFLSYYFLHQRRTGQSESPCLALLIRNDSPKSL